LFNHKYNKKSWFDPKSNPKQNQSQKTRLHTKKIKNNFFLAKQIKHKGKDNVLPRKAKKIAQKPNKNPIIAQHCQALEIDNIKHWIFNI
jgi:hypothetical protein